MSSTNVQVFRVKTYANNAAGPGIHHYHRGTTNLGGIGNVRLL